MSSSIAPDFNRGYDRGGARPQSCLFPGPDNNAQRLDCLAEVVGLELRNVVAKYPFERSHRFPGIHPNFGHRDYSRLSGGVEVTQTFSLRAAACLGAPYTNFR